MIKKIKNEIMQWIQKLDKLWLGLLLGLIAPVVTLIIVFCVTFKNYNIPEFFHFLKTMRVMSKLFSLCLLPNLGLFFLFIWPNNLKGAKGVLSATIVVAAFILVIQYFTAGIFVD
jgi:hypothetical protein